MQQECFNSLAISFTECEISSSLNVDKILKVFAEKKASKITSLVF